MIIMMYFIISLDLKMQLVGVILTILFNYYRLKLFETPLSIKVPHSLSCLITPMLLRLVMTLTILYT